MGPLGGPELILILVIALIVFGPRKLPEIGKSMGKMMVEFRRASTEFKRTLETEVETEKAATSPARTAPGALPPPSAPGVGSDPDEATASADAQTETPDTDMEKDPTPEGTVPQTPSGPSEGTPS